jgi:plastocyanin
MYCIGPGMNILLFKTFRMKAKFSLTLVVLFSFFASGICTNWTITNSGLTFTPDTLRITLGDGVDFSLESIHNAVEVSQETWNANGNTALEGGFSVPLGGGSVSPDLLTAGTHWYVCEPHASTGMKGVIIVDNVSATEERLPEDNISFFPNPAHEFITVQSNSDLSGSPYLILNLAGKQVLTGIFEEESGTIDISSFESGIYLLQVGEERRRIYKLMKN